MSRLLVDFYSLRKGDLVLVDVWNKNSFYLYPALVMSNPANHQMPNSHAAFSDRVAVVIDGMAMASTANRISIKRYISRHNRIERPIVVGYKRKTDVPAAGADLEYDVLFRTATIHLVQQYLSDRITAAEVARPGATL